MNIRDHFNARYPFVFYQTTEDERLIRESRALFDTKPDKEPTQFFTWDCAVGLQAMVPVNSHGWTFKPLDPKMTDPLKIFDVLRGDAIPENAVIWMKDFHKFLDPQAPASIRVIRQALNLKDELKRKMQTIAFLGAVKVIPPEMKDDVTVLDFEYPDEEALRKIVQRIAADNAMDAIENEDAVINALRGLTSEGAENSLALVLSTVGFFDVKTLLDLSAAQISTDGVLTYGKFKETFDDLFGMRRAIEFFKKTTLHPKSRGSILYGVPGCAKSHIIKAIANYFGLPCFVLSFGNVRDKYQGVGEAKLQSAFKVIRAKGKCIVICDELDKALMGSEGGADTDGGFGARVLGELLQEMENMHQSECGARWFATCNNLDPILTMSGGALQRRFDALWFTDLPTPTEALGIAKIWSKKEGVEIPGNFNFQGYSGADIAKLAGQMAMLECSAEEASQYVIPYGKANASELEKIRSKAKGVCIWANDEEELVVKVATRKVRRAA